MSRLMIDKWGLGLLVFMVLVLAPHMVGAQAADDYGYRSKNQAEEKRKYLKQLSEDKKKIELAIKNTKQLIDRSRNKPYLPELYLRLAELHVEQSRVVYFCRKGQRDGEKSVFDQLESNTLKKKAIEIYQRILDNFPEYESRDKVHFFMAHEFRELGDHDAMIGQYRKIIKELKNSDYVPEAYLLLGDHFINRQDLDMAKRQYEAVLNYPGSPSIAIARYKLAWCHINKGEFCDANKLFEEAVKTLETGKQLDIDTYKRVDIKLESLIDMAYCYAECYKKSTPEAALDYFEEYAWSRPVYTTVLEKLAHRYYLKKKWLHAAQVYRHLATLQHDAEKLMEYARNVVHCVQASGDYSRADQDTAMIVKALKKQRYSIHIPNATKEKNTADYELYARSIVTHLHNQARKKKSVADFALAARSYRSYLDFFDTSPVLRDMVSNYAETLFSSQQYLEAGKMYEELPTRSEMNGDAREAAIYGAVISYYNALKNKASLNYYQVAFARDGLRTNGKRYAQQFPNSKRVPDVLFNVAWIAYDAGEYDNAIAEFSRFIDAYPNRRSSRAAVHLILDAYNLKEDNEGLVKFGKQVIGRKDIRDKKLKIEVAEIVHGTESKIISTMTLAILEDWEKGKSDLLAFAEQGKSTEMGEQALHTLVMASKEKGDLVTLFSAGDDLIEKYPRSDNVENTLDVMIDASLRAALFRLVADHLEAFTLHLPTHKNSLPFLQQAGRIREHLGQYDLSNKNYSTIVARYGKNRSVRQDTVFRMAANASQSRNSTAALQLLRKNRDTFNKVGRVRADATIAGLYIANKQSEQARPHLRRATRDYRAAMDRQDPVLKHALAEAVFYSLEDAHKQYMALQLENRIDNDVVQSKTQLLAKLEKGYQSVMAYQSPAWALQACFRAHEINGEFARFLRSSPLPELTDAQQKQYVALIEEKANGYSDKANQYQKSCITLAHKWEICNPTVIGCYRNSGQETAGGLHGASFSGEATPVEIGKNSISDRLLRPLHDGLLQKPDDHDLMALLSEAYNRRGDYQQAGLVAEKALGELPNTNELLKARLYNSLGIARLYGGDDEAAKNAFQKALAADAKHVGARMNLAALLQYYGHTESAGKIYSTLPQAISDDADKTLIHPRAMELYHDHTTQKLAKY